MNHRFTAVCLAAATMILLPGHIFGQATLYNGGVQTRSLITQPVDNNIVVALSGNTPSAALQATDLGAVAGTFPMDHLLLQLQRPPELEQALVNLIDEMNRPGSPEFHHWLTTPDLGRRFGLSQQDMGRITGWLTSQGFQINSITPTGMMVEFSGTAAQVSAAFHTQIHNLVANGVPHISNMSDPQIPAALAGAVKGVVSLHNFMPHTNYLKRTEFTVTISGTTYQAVGPADLAKIYNLNPLFAAGITGAGTTIAVIEDTLLHNVSDVATFRTAFGLSGYAGTFSQVTATGTLTCGNSGVNGAEGEAALDAEWAGAAAPGSAILLASCRDTVTNFGGLIALQNLLSGASPPPIVSISYGYCESDNGSVANAAYVNTYQQAAALGVSVFVSAGDQGAAVCDYGASDATHGIAVNGFASTPYNVAVGGTDFSDTYSGTVNTYWSGSNSVTYESALSYIPETPWNDSCAGQLLFLKEGFTQAYGTTGFCNSTLGHNFLTTAAGSGGPSAFSSQPAWQTGVFGLPTQSGGPRYLPDVSLFAANGLWGHFFVFCMSDTAQGGVTCDYTNPTDVGNLAAGGTSFSSPIMAGIMALVNQKTGSLQGNPNPRLYALAGAAYGASGSTICNSSLGNTVDSSCTFYDVTLGDIDVNCRGTFNCYIPSSIRGVLSTSNAAFAPAYPATTGWDFATGIGTVNAYNLVNAWVSAELIVSKTHSPATFAANDVNDSITITVTNNGNAASSGTVTVTDTLPTGLTFNGSPTAGWSCNANASNPVVCTTTNAIGSAGGTLSLVLHVNVAASTASPLTNNVSVGCTCFESLTNNNTNTDSIPVTQLPVLPPTISKAFGASSIGLNGTTTVTFTITNPVANVVAQTGVAFSDPLPSGLTVGNTPGVIDNCGGTVTAAANSSSISLTGGTVGISTNCTITVTVLGTTSGAKDNTTGAVSSTNGGTGLASNTATVVVGTPPTIAKAFSPTQIPVGGTSTVTFTIANRRPSVITQVAFSDTLTGGLQVAGSPGVTNTCNGTVTAVAGSTSISLADGLILPYPMTCTISVVVTGTVGVKTNTTGPISSLQDGTGLGSNTATLTIVGPPTVTKSFGAASIPLGTNVTLTFTLANPNSTVVLTGIGFSDPLPAGLIVASPPNVGGTCGGAFNPSAGATSLSVSAVTLAANATCTITVSVTGIAAGNQSNTTGAITSTEGGTSTGSNTAVVAVVAPPTISKAFGAATIPLNTTTALTFTITNPAANTVAQTGVAFSDLLPVGLLVDNTPGVIDNCGGTVTATANTGTISLAGGTVGINTNCTITVTVRGWNSGVKNNTTGAVSSTNGGTGTVSNTATVLVGSPATIAKAFSPTQITLGGTSTVTFTITNPNDSGLTGLAFSDTLTGGLQVAASPNVSNTCNGTVTAVGGGTSISLTGGTVAVTCTISVVVTGTVGVKTNTTGPLSSTEGGTGSGSNTATLTIVGPPTVTKSFGAASIPLGTNVLLTFTIANLNPTVGLTGIGFSDPLPAGLAVASVPGAGGTCVGAFNPTAGATSLSVSGVTLAAGLSCTLTVSVTGTAAGNQSNTTGAITSVEGGTGTGSNTATVAVVAPPTISKAFGAATISLNATTTVTFTITNPAANTVAQTGVAFSDTLPAGLTVGNTPGVIDNCGGTVTAAANSSSISLSGGTVGINTNCTITVTVLGTTVGVKNNTTGGVSSTTGGTGTVSNTATVTVQAADLIVSKTHSPASFIVFDQNDTIAITVTNNGNVASSGTVTVTDTLPVGLTFNGSPTAGWSCNANGSNPVVCTTTNAIASAGGTSALSLHVNVAGSTASPLTNNVAVACTCVESNTGNNTNTDSITVLQVVNITLATSPTGLQVSGDGGVTYFTAPHVFQWIPTSQHTIVTTSPQSPAAGVMDIFQNWSDSGAISHIVTTPAAPATITANFQTQYLLTTQTNASAVAGSISPPTGYYVAGTVVTVTATANPGFVFTGFTGDLTGTANPQNLTMNAPETVTANFTGGPTSLSGSLVSRTGPSNARVWQFTIADSGPGGAVAAEMLSLSLRPTSPARAVCNPPITVLSPLPAVAGDLPPHGTGTVKVTIDFSGCPANTLVGGTAVLSGNGGAATGSIFIVNQLP